MTLFQWPESGAVSLTCEKKWLETSDCISLLLRSDNPNALFTFIPGQFLTVGVSINGEVHYRAYSISSIPNTDLLQLTIKRVNGGVVSNYLVDHFSVGEGLSVLKPAGEFHINQPRKSDIALISAGCGITPVMSMARALLNTTDDKTNIHFLHAATCKTQLIYHQELLALNEQHTRFHLSIVLEDAQETDYVEGRLTQAAIAKFCPEIEQRSAFICGPAGFMQSVGESLEALGVDSNHIYQESFKPDQFTHSDVLTQVKDKRDASGVNVYVPSFESNTQVEMNSLLIDALEQAKLPVIAACRSGICGSCKSQITKGQYTRTSVQTLTEQELADGYVLACSCKVESDVEVNIS